MTLKDFFREKGPEPKKLYKLYLEFVKSIGPIRVNVNKSRISFQTRIRFAGVKRVNKNGLVCAFLLKRRIHSTRFRSIEFIPPNYYVYEFLLKTPAELDNEMRGWLQEAYAVGQQKYIKKEGEG